MRLYHLPVGCKNTLSSFPVGFLWDLYINKDWYHPINPCNQVAKNIFFFIYSPFSIGSRVFFNLVSPRRDLSSTPVSRGGPAPRCSVLLLPTLLQVNSCGLTPVPQHLVLACVLLRTGQRLSSLVLVLDLLLFLLRTSQ